MSLRFRRSIRIAPGVHVNLGFDGAGLSVGPRGLHFGVNRRGMDTSAGHSGNRDLRGAPHPPGSTWPVILLLAVLLLASCVKACA